MGKDNNITLFFENGRKNIVQFTVSHYIKENTVET